MKHTLTKDFQTELWQTIKSIEENSQAEVVVVLRSSSDDYRSTPLIWGIFAVWISHTYMVYSPPLFEDWLVYSAPIVAFFCAYAFAHLPTIKRLSNRKARRQKNVEIMARALFQKGGIRHTRCKTGVLIYCSLLEQRVYILPDRGIEMAIPPEEWQGLQRAFNLIFKHKQPLNALLAELHNTRALFGRYLPALPEDVNELPDALEIDL